MKWFSVEHEVERSEFCNLVGFNSILKSIVNQSLRILETSDGKKQFFLNRVFFFVKKTCF